MAQQPLMGQGLLIIEAFRLQSHHTRYLDDLCSVRLLWTNDQSDAETSTWQNKIHKKQTSMPPTGFEPAIPAGGRLPYFVEIAFNVCANIKYLSKYNRKNVTLTSKYKWHLRRFYSTEQTPAWRANNSSASQENPSFYGTRGLSPFSLSSTELVEPPPTNKIPGYATASD